MGRQDRGALNAAVAVAAGVALRDCHEALRSFDGALPLLGNLTEAEALLAALRAPIQALHGDAHLNNVLPGPKWIDWEDTCLGPLGWDAACLLAGRHGADRQSAAYAASRMEVDEVELGLWVLWTAFLRT